METIWGTVDRLIHDLGAVRAVVDEMESLPEPSAAPTLDELRVTMGEATDAITRIFSDTQDSVVEAAWQAMARAQDAARQARACIAATRAARDSNEAMTEHARAQAARAHDHRQMIERAWRVRERPLAGGPAAARVDDEEQGKG